MTPKKPKMKVVKKPVKVVPIVEEVKEIEPSIIVEEIQEAINELQPEVKGKLKFLIPSWAIWAFCTEFLLNKGFIIWISSTYTINPYSQKGIVLVLAIVDVVFLIMVVVAAIKRSKEP